MPSLAHLVDTSSSDGWWALLVLDGTGAGTASLNGLDGTSALEVVFLDLTEDDVAAIEPAGDDGGDEELGAIGVGASVGHGEHVWLVVGELEVLVGELFTVDGLSTSALMEKIDGQHRRRAGGGVDRRCMCASTYVTTGEVTTLKHELRDDTVELGASVAEALLAGAEGTEVLGRLWDYIIEELEVDAGGAC
jgi:hypothetical protein